MSIDIAPEPRIPKDFWKAMAIPEWNKAIDTELTKFETNNCFQFVPDTGQHLVPMMWLFNKFVYSWSIEFWIIIFCFSIVMKIRILDNVTLRKPVSSGEVV
jgi:hypothetical protein